MVLQQIIRGHPIMFAFSHVYKTNPLPFKKCTDLHFLKAKCCHPKDKKLTKMLKVQEINPLPSLLQKVYVLFTCENVTIFEWPLNMSWTVSQLNSGRSNSFKIIMYIKYHINDIDQTNNVSNINSDIMILHTYF